jgi:hypothetical protein
MLEDDLDLDYGNWKKLNGLEEKRTKVVLKYSRKLS